MEVRDVQNIADILVDPEGALERRNHWEKTSHSLLVGAILHVLYAEEDKTLAGVADLPLRSASARSRRRSRRMMTTTHLGEAGAASGRRLAPRASCSTSPRTSAPACSRPPCRSSASTAIPPSRRSRRAATGGSPISSRRASGLALSGRAAVRHQPHQAARPPGPQPDRPAADRELQAEGGRPSALLLMLDEFPALGRLDFFETRARLHGGLRRSRLPDRAVPQPDREGLWREQLRSSTTAMSASRFATNDERTAKRISDALGTATEHARDAQLCRPPALALARPCHGVAAGDRAPAADARRGDAASARPTRSSWSPGIRRSARRSSRYFEDARFQERILPPPSNTETRAYEGR